MSYNGIYWYDRCLSSLRKSIIPLNVIVVDNSSTDDTLNFIRNNYKEVQLISMDSNIGFGRANNVGINIARQNNADYVFLLNQDTWVEPDTISKLIDIHQNHPELGIVCPIHLDNRKKNIEKGLMTYLSSNYDFINDSYFGNIKELYLVNYVNAAAWLIPINIIEQIGGFDPLFFHYGEDDNYMQRIHFWGYKIGLCPSSRIVHDTERRVKISEKAKQTDMKTLLVKLSDINDFTPVSDYILLYLKKVVTNFFRFRFKSCIEVSSYVFFISKIKKNIESSKRQNRTKGVASWL